MVRVEDIIKQLMQEINVMYPYPTYNIYIGNLREKAHYPCFLIYLGLETNQVTGTELIKKTLMVDVVYYNSNKEKDDADYIAKVKVKDELEDKLLNELCLKVKNTNIKMDYSTTNADDLLNITLKLTYFNSIVKEKVDHELIQEILLNTRKN